MLHTGPCCLAPRPPPGPQPERRRPSLFANVLRSKNAARNDETRSHQLELIKSDSVIAVGGSERAVASPGVGAPQSPERRVLGATTVPTTPRPAARPKGPCWHDLDDDFDGNADDLEGPCQKLPPVPALPQLERAAGQTTSKVAGEEGFSASELHFVIEREAPETAVQHKVVGEQGCSECKLCFTIRGAAKAGPAAEGLLCLLAGWCLHQELQQGARWPTDGCQGHAGLREEGGPAPV